MSLIPISATSGLCLKLLLVSELNSLMPAFHFVVEWSQLSELLTYKKKREVHCITTPFLRFFHVCFLLKVLLQSPYVYILSAICLDNRYTLDWRWSMCIWINLVEQAYQLFSQFMSCKIGRKSGEKIRAIDSVSDMWRWHVALLHCNCYVNFI